VNDQTPHPEELRPKASSDKGGEPIRPVTESKLPPTAPTGEPAPANQLTPEEQMALFEKELKEKDWGHQPC
jgi:hypothetical protein